MASFEQLLNDDEESLGAMFARYRTKAITDPDRQLESIAQSLGLNTSQAICGFGFNLAAIRLARIPNVLGFSSYDALWGQRNFLLINDVYRYLTIDNVIEIYRAVSRDPESHDFIPDLVLTRLNNIEAQIEETINPVMLGSYKLEIRAIYENKVASADLIKARLGVDYGVLRDLAEETILMVENEILSGKSLLANAGVSVDEKRVLLFRGLVSKEQVRDYLDGEAATDLDRKLLSEALNS
jgi:hypothetical protein